MDPKLMGRRRLHTDCWDWN